MKKLINYILVFAVGVTFISCEKLIMKPNAKTNPVAIFQEYTTIVKEKYGMLEFKKVNMDHLSDSLRPFVFDEMSDDSLFGVLSVVVQRLKDGHTSLEIPNVKSSNYDFISAYDSGFDLEIMIDNYIGKNIAPSIKTLASEGDATLPRLIYGFLPQNNEIGYIWIPSFSTEISEEELDTVFASFQSAKGLIVDVRQNTGGDPILATKIAAYFTNQDIVTGYENFKTGPGTNDFGKSPSVLKPASSEYKFLKPVVVCTDRFVYSAGSTFCYSVSPNSNVKFVGQRTGGGSGSVGGGYLSNGWVWNMSISEFVGVDDTGNDMHLDNGFEPDISVVLDTLDKTKDEVLERALLELQ